MTKTAFAAVILAALFCTTTARAQEMACGTEREAATVYFASLSPENPELMQKVSRYVVLGRCWPIAKEKRWAMRNDEVTVIASSGKRTMLIAHVYLLPEGTEAYVFMVVPTDYD